MDIIKLRKDLIDGKINVSDVSSYIGDIKCLYEEFMNGLRPFDKDEVFNLIMIFLDYYTYSTDGDSLISDKEYDDLMNYWIGRTHHLISKSDILTTQTHWEFVKHESPGMVGTIKKIYSFEELVAYMSKYKSHKGYRSYRIAPKFDGISAAIKIDSNGKILLGVTRNDGVRGQDITSIVRNAENSEEIAAYYALGVKSGEYVWVKVELCVGTHNFNDLCEIKNYKNRRSATSGIVNSPKNVSLAKFITIIPLASHQTSSDNIGYTPLNSKMVTPKTPYDMMEEINKLLSIIRDPSFNFRVDGVVIYPLGDDILPNFDDIMDDAIAYKVNTSEGLTRIKYAYISVGRLGYACPMLKVEPCEVNETCVQDVSLGSFDKFANMDLHENEQVIIYSAGDVIPQAKLPEERNYDTDAPLIKIKKVCPYCGEKLHRYENTYQCKNPDCPRIKSGYITNFIMKLKGKNISDETINDLIEHKLIFGIPDLFKLKEEQIACLPGYGTDSAKNIITELTKIKTRAIPISQLIGALGIQGISEKKCQKIFKVMNLDKMLKKNPEKLKYDLVSADSTGYKTASIFVDFIMNNKKLIHELCDVMNISEDISWKGNVVFTGFRNPALEKKFNEIGYEVSNNVNGKTVVVIDASYNHDSTKCESARKKGIDIVHVSKAEDILKQMDVLY